MARRYQVHIYETAVYGVQVVASSRAEACKKAEAMFLNGDEGIKIGAPFSCDITDRDVNAVAIKRRKR